MDKSAGRSEDARKSTEHTAHNGDPAQTAENSGDHTDSKAEYEHQQTLIRVEPAHLRVGTYHERQEKQDPQIRENERPLVRVVKISLIEARCTICSRNVDRLLLLLL